MSSDQPTLVIGGTRGTGRLIAMRLLAQGAPVRVLARNPDRAIQRFPPQVEVVGGDITKTATLLPALMGVHDIVFTAGCRSGRPASQHRIRATEYEGVLRTLDAADRADVPGRFLYMTSSGVGQPSLPAMLLNLYKGNTLLWRLRAEEAIRASDLIYTIIRTGVLLNRPGGHHAIKVSQTPLPLSPRYRIARADVAEAFVTALHHPRTPRTTFELAWGSPGQPGDWEALLTHLVPDDEHPRERPNPRLEPTPA